MTRFFDLLREAIDAEPHRISERPVRRPPWQPQSISKDVIYAFIRGPFEDQVAPWTESPQQEENDIMSALLAPIERRKDLCSRGDARALMKLSTERKFLESKQKLAKYRTLLLAVSQQYEPGPVNLPLPTLESIIKADVARHLNLSADRVVSEEIDLEAMIELHLKSYKSIILPNTTDAREIRSTSRDSIHHASAVKRKVTIAEQDIGPYLLGLEMPVADVEPDDTCTYHVPHLGHVSMSKLNNIRGRTKATEYLPWHLFGRRRAFWSHNLVGRPSGLYLSKIEQSVRRSTFYRRDMLGRRMTLSATLFNLVRIVPAWCPPIPASKSISSDELRIECVRDMSKRRKQAIGEEDVEAMFLENVWAQNREFNKRLDQQRNRMREVMSQRRRRAQDRIIMASRSDRAEDTIPIMSASTVLSITGRHDKGKKRAMSPSDEHERDCPPKRCTS